MIVLDHKESWAVKNWCFWTVVLEKILESPLDSKENNSVNTKGNQFWMFIGRTDAEAETPVLWPPDAKNWLIGKDLDAGKDWTQEEKRTTGDEMVGWHHRINGHGFEWTPGVGDAQGGLECCSPWGRKELDTNERLNWTELIYRQSYTWTYIIMYVKGSSPPLTHWVIVRIKWASMSEVLCFFFFFLLHHARS